jgi:hypothetical protein
LTVRTETNAANIEVTVFRERGILQVCNLIASLYVIDLSGTVASSGYEPAVKTEAYTAHHTLVGQIVDKVHIEHTASARVEDGKPIIAVFLEVGWQLLNIEIGQSV